MKYVVTTFLLLLSSPALAADTLQNGTFAGDKPRGQSVSAAAGIYKDAGSNYGQSWAEPRTQEPHNQPGPGSEVANDIQAHIGPTTNNPSSPEIVGYGRDK